MLCAMVRSLTKAGSTSCPRLESFDGSRWLSRSIPLCWRKWSRLQAPLLVYLGPRPSDWIWFRRRKQLLGEHRGLTLTYLATESGLQQLLLVAKNMAGEGLDLGQGSGPCGAEPRRSLESSCGRAIHSRGLASRRGGGTAIISVSQQLVSARSADTAQGLGHVRPRR